MCSSWGWRAFVGVMHTHPRMFPNRPQWRLTNMKKTFVLFVVLLLANGCSVGPHYKRPVVDVPGSFRAASAPEVTQTESTSPQTPRPEALSSRDGQPANNRMGKI